jgi:phage terminase large subunit-like protein
LVNSVSTIIGDVCGRRKVKGRLKYALAVVEGREIASRLARLACQRHLDDLQPAIERGLEWRVDEVAAVCDFFPEILRLPDSDDDDDGGESRPLRLDGREQFVAGSLLGWYAAGHRRYRVAYCEAALVT